MRKPKLTYEMVDRAVALKKDGLSNDDIIKALGIHKSTFYRWLKEAEEGAGGCKRALNDSLKKAEVEYKKTLLTSIRNASMKPQHWTAAAWLLERKYPMEFGKTDRREEKADEPVQLTLGLELEVMDEGESDGGGAGADSPSVGIDGALAVGVAARAIEDGEEERSVAGGAGGTAVGVERAGSAGTPGSGAIAGLDARDDGRSAKSAGAGPGGYSGGGYWDGGSGGGLDAYDFDEYWDGGE